MRDRSTAVPARLNVSSGSSYEATVGYSRAVRVGDTIHVAGTTAIGDAGEIVGEGDLYAQASFVLGKIERALQQAGATMADVVRTRAFVTDISRWEEFGRAHGECFRDVRPAATLVEVARLIDRRMMIEIEVDAVVRG